MQFLLVRGLSGKELAKRVGARFGKDDVLGRSAGLAYYFFLAIFPMLLFLIALLGMFAGAGTQLRANLIAYLTHVMPGQAGGLIQQTVDHISTASNNGLLSFGILAAMWSASSGMSAIQDALNSAYQVKESRSWIKARFIALWLTVALSVLVVCALALLLYGGKIADAIAGPGNILSYIWKVVQWPVLIFFLLLAFDLVYRFAPNVKARHWRWITVGATSALVLWLVASFSFRLYLQHSSSYKVYGLIGSVMALLLWFYISGIAILIGGEINSVIEDASAKKEERNTRSHRDQLRAA